MKLAVGKTRSPLSKRIRPSVRSRMATPHHTLKLVSDVADAGIELFPQQIAAGVGTSGFGFLLANSIRRKHEGNGQCRKPHVPIFAAAHSQSRARFWSAATCGFTARSQIPARGTRIRLSVWEN